MSLEPFNKSGFIRGHCGSVTSEAPQGRATGAQRRLLNQLPSVHLQGKGVYLHFNHPAGQVFPSGMHLRRIFNI